jgi:hypothetical protein
MTRAEKIKLGKIWHVYPDDNPDNILFEGSKTACMTFIKEKFGIRQYNNGTIRRGQLIWEDGPQDYSCEPK